MLVFASLLVCLAMGSEARAKNEKILSGDEVAATFLAPERLAGAGAADDSALSDAGGLAAEKDGTPAALGPELKQPTANGALENTREFREAAWRAWAAVSYGDLPQEAGAMILRDGRATRVQVSKEIRSGEISGATVFQIPMGGIFAVIHTHPRASPGKKWIQEPSATDIEVAKNNGENVYVVTSSGLWQVEPSGKVNHVFTNHAWMRVGKKGKSHGWVR